MFTKGDFHIHSTASDGELTPKEIIQLAKEKGVDILSITDHNTVNGVDEAIKEGERLDIKVIPGVEVSTVYNGRRVHILAYFKDDRYKWSIFKELLYYIKFGKIHDIKALLERKVDYYRCSKRLCTSSAIDILNLFGASIVLAHPGKLNREIYKEVANLKIHGIEAKHTVHSKEDMEFFMKEAELKGLFYTGGTDFHGYKKASKKHGIIGDTYLNSIEIEKFLNELGI